VVLQEYFNIGQFSAAGGFPDEDLVNVPPHAFYTNANSLIDPVTDDLGTFGIQLCRIFVLG
jgi:hypothetical protein